MQIIRFSYTILNFIASSDVLQVMVNNEHYYTMCAHLSVSILNQLNTLHLWASVWGTYIFYVSLNICFEQVDYHWP